MPSSDKNPVSPGVKKYLEELPRGHFIGGKWKKDPQADLLDVYDPGRGEVIGRICDAGEDDVAEAVAAARRAFCDSGWARLTPNERGVHLHRLADLIEDHAETLSQLESLDVGKPLAQAVGDVASFPKSLRYYADLAVQARYREPIPVSRHEARTVRQPYGVCGFILPWNFPFLLAGWNLSPALAAGNTVVLKPAEDASLSSLYLGELVGAAGIPAGVVNIVTGVGERAGAALSRHPGLDRVGFTGSPEVGRLVGEACARNLVPVKLELGGKGAAVVFEDVDLAQTADALTRAVTLNTGQVCCTATRWLIHEKIYDRFVDVATQRMGQVRIGYGRDAETEMGPLISLKQKDRVLGYLDRGVQEGAEAVLAGGPAEVKGREAGYYVQAALLAGSHENVACREEIFGPVAYLLKFGSEEEAVDLVNRSHYGLANSVWSKDAARADRVAEAMVAGNSWINAHNVFPYGVPYAGVKASGLGGGVLSPQTLFDYLRELSVVRPL